MATGTTIPRRRLRIPKAARRSPETSAHRGIDTGASASDAERANLRVLPFDREIFTSVQWYEVVSGRRPEAISGATSTTLNVTLDAKKRGPQYYYARVTLRGITEESRTATLSELTGEPAFHARLLNKGYTTADISNPQFDNLDPDHNGLTHFAEYALGLLPGRAPRWQLGITPVPAESGQPGGTDLLVSLPALQPGVRYILQTSPDGQAWADFMVLESDPQDDSPPVIRVPGGENTKLLVRLKLSAIP